MDALRLLAVVISHWDNKPENQRITCLPGGDQPDGGCTTPLALIQDLGATFGPLQSRSAQLAPDAGVVGPRDLHGQHEDAAVRRRDVPAIARSRKRDV